MTPASVYYPRYDGVHNVVFVTNKGMVHFQSIKIILPGISE